MRTLITKTWAFYTYSITGQCKCYNCGKTIKKTFSFEYREDTVPDELSKQFIENEREEWLKHPHMCNACKKEQILQERKDITNSFDEQFDTLNKLQKDIIDIKLSKSKHIKNLNEELKDKVILYNNKEYVIRFVTDGYVNDVAVEIYANQINKTKPWLETDNSIIFYKRAYKQPTYTNFINIEEAIITDEVFSKRRSLLNVD